MTGPRVRFASFEFDTATGELWLDGRRIRFDVVDGKAQELTVEDGPLVVRAKRVT